LPPSAAGGDGGSERDAKKRSLVFRENLTPSGTTQYLYDPFGHVLMETDQNGVSLREYIWPDDMPIGIIDQVNMSSPVLYFVHADHLDRPIMVTNGAGASIWQAIWTPFGAAWSITGSLTYDARFPGQWFQIESGLHYNWNPTTIRPPADISRSIPGRTS
jgi:YD repeat-containing protein